jgi:hypothetical protein
VVRGAQALKAIDIEGLLAYLCPRKYVVNSVSRFDDALCLTPCTQRIFAKLSLSQHCPLACVVFFIRVGSFFIGLRIISLLIPAPMR